MKRLLPILLFALWPLLTYAENYTHEEWKYLSKVSWLEGETQCYDYLDLSAATKKGVVSTFGEFVVLGDYIPKFSEPATYTRTFSVSPDQKILVIHVCPDFDENCGRTGDSISARITITVNGNVVMAQSLTNAEQAYSRVYYYDLRGQTSVSFSITARDCSADAHSIRCKFAVGCFDEFPFSISKHYCDNADSLVTLSLSNSQYSEGDLVFWSHLETPNNPIYWGTSFTVPANQGKSYQVHWLPKSFIGQASYFTQDANDDNTAVTSCPSYETYDSIYVYSKTEPILWNNHVLYAPCSVTDSFATKRYGCDSICHMRVKLIQTIYEKDTTCLFPYSWHGQQLTQSGNYQSEQIYGPLEDTIFYLNLAYKECDPHEWQDGNPLNPTLLCDTAYSTLDTTIYCDSLLWFDKWYYTSGTYHDTLKNVTSTFCDSIGTLVLKVLDTSTSSDTTAYTCYGVPFIWHGKEAKDGDTIMRKNVFGCDSIVTLKLFVSEAPVTIPLKDTASCQLVPFLWRGHQIISDTLCFDTLRTTKLGCDSIYASLRFVVKEPTASDTSAYVCYEDLPFIWHGKEAKNGDTIMLINRAGCDSIVTLRLTTSSKPIVWNIDTTICDTLLPYKWREQNFTAIYTYRDTIYNARGCDSIYRSFTLDTIHCVRPEPPVPPEPPVDTCVSNLVYRKWVDFIFCDNGRDEFVAFQWYRNNLSLAGETGQYLYLPGTMGAAEYFVEATKTDGTKIRTCPLIFDNTPRSRDTYVNVQTVIRRGQPLQIAMSDPEADIAIYTLVGQPVLSAHILGPETSLPIPLPAGTYVLRLIGANINTTTKILIE